jgi:predicted thioredoxin/glutaredoxin
MFNFDWDFGENWTCKGGEIGDLDLRADTFPLYVGFLVNRIFERLKSPMSKFSIRLEHQGDILLQNEISAKDFIEGWNSDLMKETIGATVRDAIFVAEELKAKKRRLTQRLKKSDSVAEWELLMAKYPSLQNLKV